MEQDKKNAILCVYVCEEREEINHVHLVYLAMKCSQKTDGSEGSEYVLNGQEDSSTHHHYQQ